MQAFDALLKMVIEGSAESGAGHAAGKRRTARAKTRSARGTTISPSTAPRERVGTPPGRELDKPVKTPRQPADVLRHRVMNFGAGLSSSASAASRARTTSSGGCAGLLRAATERRPSFFQRKEAQVLRTRPRSGPRHVGAQAELLEMLL